MSDHRIDPHRGYVAGESLRWTFTVMKDDSVHDLSGGSVEWELVDDKGDDTVILDHTDSNVSIGFVTDGSDGEVELLLDPNATTGMGGDDYWHRLTVTDSAGSTKIRSGLFPIDEP